MARSLNPVIVAFAVSPLAASTVLAIWLFIFGKFFAPPAVGISLGAIIAIFFGVSLFSGYLAAIVLGVPGYFLLRRVGWVRRRWCFLLGIVMGGAAGTLLMTMVYGHSNDAQARPMLFLLGAAILSGPPALAMGLVFMWLIRRAGPDIDKIAATFD